MAQYDLILVQNTAPSGIEYTEKNINLAKGSLLSADASSNPTVLAAGTNGYMLVRDDAQTTGLAWQAISAGHTQNTDTGTTNPSFIVNSSSVLGKFIISSTTGAANFSMTLTNAAITGSDKTITLPDLSGTVGLLSNKISDFASVTSAELAGKISDETGSGVFVLGTSPTITTSLVAGSTSMDLFNTTATTLNIGGASTTTKLGLSGTITLGTSASATTTAVVGGAITGNTLKIAGTAAGTVNLSSDVTTGIVNAFTGVTTGTVNIGTGGASTINLGGAASTTNVINLVASKVNNMTITSSTGTFTLAAAKVLTVNNTLTFSGTDSSSVAFGAGGTVAYTGNNLSVFAATTSAQLAGIISDETGTDKVVFNTTPTFVTSLLTSSSTFSLFDSVATTLTAFAATTALTLGYSGTAASTTNISTGAVASATTKTINIGTGGAASSTTNVNIGSSNGGTVTLAKDVVVTGNLTVQGTTFTVNSETMTVDDNIIVLNNNVSSGSPTEDGGIQIRRGASTSAGFKWNETTDTWQAGLVGSEVDISLSGHTHWVASPATKTSTGTAGQMAYDGNYLYICTATNTWKRTALATNW